MHQLIAENSEYIGEGHIHARIYEIDGYPGAIESDKPDEKVVGELYSISNREILLAELDYYEGCSEDYPHPQAYVRKQLSVLVDQSLPEGDESNITSVSAWVYIYNHPVSEDRLIPSGDYFQAND